MTVSDNRIQGEGLGDFFRNLGKKGPNVRKKIAKKRFKNPGPALEIGANIGTAFASESPKAALSGLPEMINFFHAGKRLYLEKFARFYQYKCNEKEDCTHLHHQKTTIWNRD